MKLREHLYLTTMWSWDENGSVPSYLRYFNQVRRTSSRHNIARRQKGWNRNLGSRSNPICNIMNFLTLVDFIPHIAIFSLVVGTDLVTPYMLDIVINVNQVDLMSWLIKYFGYKSRHR